MVKVKIGRCLKQYGSKPYYVIPMDYSVKVKRMCENFYTLNDLKKYYGITKVTKLDSIGKAVNGKGKVITWTEYSAEIDDKYII